MDSGTGTRALPRAGFPIRISRDQRLVSTYSGLFAAAHVLHRLLAPRHPPCALSLLIVKNTLLSLWSFQGARALCAQRKTALEEAGLSKLSSKQCRGRHSSRRPRSKPRSLALIDSAPNPPAWI